MSKNKSCSECAETCSHLGFLEIRQILFLVKKFNRRTDTIVTRYFIPENQSNQRLLLQVII